MDIDDDTLREMGEIILNARQQGLPVQIIADIFEESFYKTTASPLKSPHASDDEKSTSSSDADDEASLNRIDSTENDNSQLLNFINLIQFYSEKAETLQNQLIPAGEMDALLAEAESKGVPRELVLKIFEIASSFEQSDDDSDDETATARHVSHSQKGSDLDCSTGETTVDHHPGQIETPVRNNISREWNFDDGGEGEERDAAPCGRDYVGLLHSMDEIDAGPVAYTTMPLPSRMRSWGELYDESVGSFDYQINKSATMSSLRNQTTLGTDPTRSNPTWESIYSDVSGSTDEDEACRTIRTQQAFGLGHSTHESEGAGLSSRSGPMDRRRHRHQPSIDSDSLVDAQLYQIMEERSIRKQHHQYSSSLETFETFETDETPDAHNRVTTNDSRMTHSSRTTHSSHHSRQTVSFLSQISTTSSSLHHQGITSIGTYSTSSPCSRSSSIEPPPYCNNPSSPNRPTDYGQTWDSNTHDEPLFDSRSTGSGSFTESDGEEEGSEYTYESCQTEELDSVTTVSQSDGSLLSLYDIQMTLSDAIIEELRDDDDDDERGPDGYEELQSPHSGVDADDDASDALSDLSMPDEGLLPNSPNARNDTLPEDETEAVEHISKKLDALIVANAEDGERPTVFRFYEAEPERALCVYDPSGSIVPAETMVVARKESSEEDPPLLDVYGNPMDNDDSTSTSSDSPQREPQSHALVPVCNELILPSSPNSRSSSSSSEDRYPKICEKFSSMEEVDDTEDIKAFFKRIVTLKKGGHLQDIRTDSLGIPSMTSLADDSPDSFEDDAVEVDRVFGYVNKELEKETPLPQSPEERLWSERRERNVFIKYADYLETLPVSVEPHTGAIVVAGTARPDSPPTRKNHVAELRRRGEHDSEVVLMEDCDVEVAYVDKEEEDRATEKSRNKVKWRFGWEFEKGLKRQDDVVLGRKVRARNRRTHSGQSHGGGMTSSAYVNRGLQHLEKIFEEREEKVWRDYENEFLLNWTSPWEKRWDLEASAKCERSSYKMMMLQEGLATINGVAAVKMMREVGFPPRGRRRERGLGALRGISRAASRSWGKKGRRGAPIDIYSLEESTALRRTPHRLDDVPWQNRNVKQRFLAEKSVTGRNWFGTLVSHKVNDKCHQPISHPKSVDVGTTFKSYPEPDSWDEEWYATWKSRKENPNNLVLHERNDEREKHFEDTRSCVTEWTPSGWTTKGSGIVNNRSGFIVPRDDITSPRATMMDDCRSMASHLTNTSRYRVYPNINSGLSTMTPSYSMSCTSSHDMAGVQSRALVPHRPPTTPFGYDSCLSVFTEEKVFSWEETPTVGMICTLRLKKREGMSRVHWEHTSFLNRSRWKRKYTPSGPFKT